MIIQKTSSLIIKNKHWVLNFLLDFLKCTQSWIRFSFKYTEYTYTLIFGEMLFSNVLTELMWIGWFHGTDLTFKHRPQNTIGLSSGLFLLEVSSWIL